MFIVPEHDLKVADKKPAPVKAKVKTPPKPVEQTLFTDVSIHDDLDPNSPNYKYRDTGYIAGSRKEMAAQQIRLAGRDGTRLRVKDIDWEEIEKNDRLAEKLIVKSNVFGRVDWQALKRKKMEPGAGFLIDRVYAAIPKEPSGEGAQTRQDYVRALETIRDRLEKAKTPSDVVKILKDIKDETDGVLMSSKDAAAYTALHEKYLAAKAEFTKKYEEFRYLETVEFSHTSRINEYDWKQQKRINRGWLRDPELDQQIADNKAKADEAKQKIADFKLKIDLPATATSRDVFEKLIIESSATRQVRDEAFKLITEKNKKGMASRCWQTFGDKFYAVLNYGSRNGSPTFRSHVTSAQAGKIRDWSWSEQEVVRAPRSSEESTRFQLKVADTFNRVGGREITVDSTEDLKNQFGLRDVQSGNWVLRDINSAKFHVSRCAEAFADMADILGIKDGKISMNGNLAMAFGARGAGSVGWSDTAASAHYENVERVINLTKMSGGGCLAHEWFHAFDNMIREVLSGEKTGSHVYGSQSYTEISDPDIRSAYEKLMSAITDGPHREKLKVKYTKQQYYDAWRMVGYNPKNDLEKKIQAVYRSSKSIEEANQVVDAHYANVPLSSSVIMMRDQYRLKIALAFTSRLPKSGSIEIDAGARSNYYMEARRLDSAKKSMKMYWRQPKEMAARAFQAYCEDTLRSKKRKNDYLASYSDNKYYDGDKPYPEGEERKRINAAFKEFFETIRKHKALKKAFELMFRG